MTCMSNKKELLNKHVTKYEAQFHEAMAKRNKELARAARNEHGGTPTPVGVMNPIEVHIEVHDSERKLHEAFVM